MADVGDVATGATDDGAAIAPALAAVMRRLEALEADNQRLRDRLDHADDRPGRTSSSRLAAAGWGPPPPARAAEPSGPPGVTDGVPADLVRPSPGPGADGVRAVSRRGLLVGGAATAAAGAVALVASVSPAAANSEGMSLTIGDPTNSATTATRLTASLGTTPTFAAYNPTGTGVGLFGRSNLASGLAADGAGVVGDSDVYPGVFGNSSTGYGVVGVTGGRSVHSGQVAGVAGDSAKLAGVAGSSNDGDGVFGTSGTGSGVYGKTGTSGFVGVAGVLGESSASYGTAGFSASKSGVRAASGTAEGIKASSTSGVGGQFSGGRAALNLVPTSATGRPTSGAHGAGDVVLDHAGALFICTVAGTPGTWVRVTTSPA